MDAMYNTIVIFATMIIFYFFFAKVINPKADIVRRIGDKVLSNQKAYNKYFAALLLGPALLVALLSLTNFSIVLRNVIMGTCLGITVFIGSEVNKYRVIKFSQPARKRRK